MAVNQNGSWHCHVSRHGIEHILRIGRRPISKLDYADIEVVAPRLRQHLRAALYEGLWTQMYMAPRDGLECLEQRTAYGAHRQDSQFPIPCGLPDPVLQVTMRKVINQSRARGWRVGPLWLSGDL